MPPTVPLWSLRLALAFCDSGPVLAAAAVARAALAAGEVPGIFLKVCYPWLCCCDSPGYLA